MLSDTLNTNEVKDSAGVEVEFTRLSISDRETVFAKVGESPSLLHRLKIAHSESGSGMKRRRRSMNRFDLTVISDVDSITPVTVSGYTVLDAPVGALVAVTPISNVLANLMSFLATTGAATTVLFDCTGNGAKALREGSL